MTTECSGRHRVPSRLTSSVLGGAAGSGTAGVAAKTGAVLAVSGGLVASLGLQAQAAPSQVLAPKTTDLGAQVTPGAPITLVSGVSAAPSYGALGFTAQVTPKPAPKPVIEPAAVVESVSEAPVVRKSYTSRTTERAPISAPEPVSVQAGSPGSAEFGAKVLSIAAKYEGIMYVYGGTTPSGFDCSGFVGYVYRQVGISLPRTSSAQRAATTRISRSEAVPGDLVFLPGHVGIYAGDGMMWDSPRTGRSIGKHEIYSSSATFGRVG